MVGTETGMAIEVAGSEDAAFHCKRERQAGMQRTRGGRSSLATISVSVVVSVFFSSGRGSERRYIPLSETAMTVEGHRKECGMKRVGEWEKEEHRSHVTAVILFSLFFSIWEFNRRLQEVSKVRSRTPTPVHLAHGPLSTAHCRVRSPRRARMCPAVRLPPQHHL